MKKIIKNKVLLIAITLIVGVLIGWLIKPSVNPVEQSSKHEHEASIAGISSIYTCSMHPQIRQSEPGDCPICGMDLIPLENEADEADPMSITMSPAALQLAGVQTMTVETGKADKTIRLNGKIQVDERLLFTQASHIPGRIEQLMVNFTGEYIAKGQTIALVYSPQLVTSQEELLQASKLKGEQPALFNAAVAKLKNWKVSEAQVEQILSSQEVIKNFPIKANVSGFVSQKFANLGDHLINGQALYEVSNLANVWVLFDVYESEIPWIKTGDEVSYTVQSIPGKTFTGKIDYLDPIINPATRVASARISVANPKLKFKPEMFVSGIVKSAINGSDEAIVVPKTAVMWTGTRSVVYVKKATDQNVSFQLREVTLGSALGSEYLVETGLRSGEEIAVNGTFSIDAAAQLAGKPSMMSPDGGAAMTGHNHGGMEMTTVSQTDGPTNHGIAQNAKDELIPIFEHYLKLKNALTQDDLKRSISQSKEMLTYLSNVNMKVFKGDAHMEWMKYQKSLTASLENIAGQKSLEEVRKSFLSISDEMIGMAEKFHPFPKPLFVQHCPMADTNRGADWLSLEEKVVNPYFGQAMETCGEVTKTIK
ncbi:efflux RND transporter periplasmic adaptor subunit [Cyclobacterium qasimii]|uniref:Cation transporter n=2 Tax=Cyclobacterium qasimii TaxID=1350429 RepID=A0A512CHQ0_9BACT|nr:efflux RND transporter periplasmic adaptor subunit [Cyclobacterium qasimii]EPR68481.1 putative Co/Zn/Cd efflux system membrane fusion protein [Cyclobacterium qasimii M12-11B]GEO23729.1 cation transporter [Cyclobacterium qasimii]